MRTHVLSADGNVQAPAAHAVHVDLCPTTVHQSTGKASTGVRSIFCDRSVLANMRRADSFGGGLGCQLLYPEHHPSAVLPQVSADSVDRSCWRPTVRFSVSLRVGSSGLLGDLAGDSGLHPADEREEVKVRLATKTLGPRGGGARAGSRH